MSRRPAFLVLVGLAVACGNTAPRRSLVTPRPTRDVGARLVAGVAEADITPPPGLALLGHGPEGRIATGTLLRLRCQVFVLARRLEAAVIIPCDLGWMSAELHREVARRLLDAGVPIGAERILISATHTHAGPAHFLGPRYYSSQFASRLPGFDPGVRDYLAERIADAVVRAWRDKAPSRIGWSQHAVYGLTRNRSFPAFAANLASAAVTGACDRPPRAGAGECPLPDVLLRAFGSRPPPEPNPRGSAAAGRIAGDAGTPPVCDPRSRRDVPCCSPIGGPACLDVDGRRASELPPAERAVDPTLTVVRIEPIDARRPMGLLAVFGVHNTAIANTNQLYHGDVFGYATRAAERDLHTENPGRAVVVGIANGVEGDVSPAIDFSGPREARRIGEALAIELRRGFGDAARHLETDVTLRRVYREIRVPNAVAGNGHHACATPALGTAAVGGAEDGPTRFRVVPDFNEGRTARAPSETCAITGDDDDADQCHGPKLQLLPPMASEYESDGTDFPVLAPLTVIRVGGLTLASVPAEVTTVVGTLARERIAAEIGPIPGRTGIALIGLAGAYLQYVASPCEYGAQHYEGASTLYGPSSASLLTTQLVCLARRAADVPTDDVLCRRQQPFEIDTVNPIPPPAGVVVHRLGEDPTDLESPPAHAAPRPVVGMRDGELSWTIGFHGIPGDYARGRTRQSVEILSDDGTVIDSDAGSSLTVRLDGDDSPQRWLATWTPYRPSRQTCGRHLRFRVRGALGTLTSEPFVLRCTPTSNEPDPAPEAL